MVLFLANHQFIWTLNTTAVGSKMYYILEMHLFRLGSRKPKWCNVVDQTVLEQLYLRMHISNLDEDFEFLGTVQLDSCSLENYPSVNTFYSSAVIIPFSNRLVE